MLRVKWRCEMLGRVNLVVAEFKEGNARAGNRAFESRRELFDSGFDGSSRIFVVSALVLYLCGFLTVSADWILLVSGAEAGEASDAGRGRVASLMASNKG